MCVCCSTGARLPDGAGGADVHGGTVLVDGQRLYRLVELPAGRAPPADARAGARRVGLRVHVRMTTLVRLPSVAQPRSGRTVLVVDDEPTIAEVVARYLERAGYETATAVTGSRPCAWPRTRRPDLIVLDLMLPGLDGLEVLRQLGECRRPAHSGDPAHRQGRAGRQARGAWQRRRRLRRQAVLAERAGRTRGRRPETRAPDGDDAEPLRFDGLEIDVARGGSRRGGRRLSSASASSTCCSSSLPTPARCSRATS